MLTTVWFPEERLRFLTSIRTNQPLETWTRCLWLSVPVGLLIAVDATLTLVGQPTTYWTGDYATALETNPFIQPLLARGPGLFVSVVLLWGGVACGLVVWCRQPLASWLAVIISLLHAVGGSSWLVSLVPFGWLVAVAYLALAAELVFWCWR